MADYFNNPMPTSGAHFVENPAKVTVERIARAIEYDADLAAMAALPTRTGKGR